MAAWADQWEASGTPAEVKILKEVGVNDDGVPVGADGVPVVAEGEIEIGEGESLEEIRAKLKPKKSSISADLLDTANTYDDKVALIRMLVQEDSGRVATVLKSMIKAS